MTISLLGTAAMASNQSVSSVSATHTLDAGANRIAIVFVSFYKSTSISVSGVTYGGNAMTRIADSGNHTNVFRGISAWYILESSLPADGSQTVTATFSASVLNAIIHVFTIQDAKQQAYEQSPTAGTYLSTGSATSSINITTIEDEAWAFSGAAADGNGTFTHGTGQTEITDSARNGASGTTMTMSASYEEITTAGAVTQTDTFSGGAVRHVGIAFSFAPEPITAVKKRLTLLGVG